MGHFLHISTDSSHLQKCKHQVPHFFKDLAWLAVRGRSVDLWQFLALSRLEIHLLLKTSLLLTCLQRNRERVSKDGDDD